jgi:predicted SAM-dependent methyltransferase
LDLVLAPSVFTHIPLDLQASWIRELHRVLRPGGLLLADVAGPAFAADILSAAERERLESGGAIEVSADHPSATVSTQLAGSVDVYQTRNQVEKAFGAIFDQRELLPGPLDLLVLRK